MTNDLFTHIDCLSLGKSLRKLAQTQNQSEAQLLKQLKAFILDPESLTKTQSEWHVFGIDFYLIIDPQTYQVKGKRAKPKKTGDAPIPTRLLASLDDDLPLREKLISLYQTKTHRRMSMFACGYVFHIVELASLPPDDDIQSIITINQRWQNGDAHFQEGRDLADDFFKKARIEQNPITKKGWQALGQLAALPHVKRHVLFALDYAIKIINLKYPDNKEKVTAERSYQIKLMQSV